MADKAPAPAQKKDVFGFKTVFRELGYYITRKEQYERALKAFDEAISKSPTDKRALMGRSIARAKAVQYQGALDDINKALELDGNDLVVLAHKALNTYLSCEFEKALVQNLRRVPYRKKPDSFVMGVMHCSEAIENCLGERAGRPLRDHFKIIRKLAWKKAREEKKPYEPKDRIKKKKLQKKLLMQGTGREPAQPQKMKYFKVRNAKSHSINVIEEVVEEEEVETEIEKAIEKSICDSLYSHKSEDYYIPPGSPFPYRPLQKYTSNIENYMAEKYLEKLYLDKTFLKELKFNAGLSCPNKSGTNKIIKIAKDGYKTLSYKQELLRTRRPFYFIKFQETSISGRLELKKAEETVKMQAAYAKDVEGLLEKLRLAVRNGKSKIAIDLSTKLIAFCEKVQKKYLPKRDLYLKEMYQLMGQTFLELKRIQLNSLHFDRRTPYQLGYTHEIPSNDSVLMQFKDIFIDYKKQIALAEHRVRKATSYEELAWLYHELARFNIELKRLDMGRVYARKCMQVANKAKCWDWVVNGQMLVVKINILQHNRNDARTEVNEAIKVVKKIKNNMAIMDFLERALHIMEQREFEDSHGSKVVLKREIQIVNMMKEAGMKEEAAHLFRQMAVLPVSRRMSVMPGIKFKDRAPKNRKYSKKRMSILPPKSDDHLDVLANNVEERRGYSDYLDNL